MAASFFHRQHAVNLAVIRIIIGAYFVYTLVDRLRGWRNVADGRTDDFVPVGVIDLLLTAPLPLEAWDLFYTTTIVFCTLFCVGLGFRFTGPACGVLFLILLSYRNSWSFIFHTWNLMAVNALVFGFAPSADTWSLDALLRRRLPNSRAVRWICGSTREEAVSWRYSWPVQLNLLLTGIAYWIAGVAKLFHSDGLTWAFDAHLLDHVGNNALRYVFLNDGATSLTYEVYSLPIEVWIGLGLLTLAVELGAPLAVLHRRMALVLALTLFGFHWGVKVLMGINFDYQLYGVAFVPFLRWDRAWARMRKMMGRSLSGRVTRISLDDLD
ncbi:MAG: hypothetical protein V3V08_03400 [Nannocystaceae bacterium]